MRASHVFKARSALSILVATAFFNSLALAVNLDDLFNVKTGTTDGGCDDKKTILQSWLDDTNTLVNTAVDGVNSYSDDKYVRRNLAAFFGIRAGSRRPYTPTGTSATKLATVTSNLAAVQSFLNGNDDRFVEGSTTGAGKPWLFCGTNWQVETTKAYEAETGNIETTTDDDGDTVEADLRTWDYGGDDEATKGILTKMQEKVDGDWSHYAYWSSDIKDYVVEEAANRYPGNPPSWCNGADLDPAEKRFALTETRQLKDAMSFCSDAFTTDCELYETISDAQNADGINALGTALGDVSPRSLTLLHELFHLTVGTADTPDIATKPTECLETSTSSTDEVVGNPDSYAFFAWSYYLTKSNTNYEWWSGQSKNAR